MIDIMKKSVFSVTFVTAIASRGMSASVSAVLSVSSRASCRAILRSSGTDAVRAASRWPGLASVRATLNRSGLKISVAKWLSVFVQHISLKASFLHQLSLSIIKHQALVNPFFVLQPLNMGCYLEYLTAVLSNSGLALDIAIFLSSTSFGVNGKAVMEDIISRSDAVEY